MWIVIGFFSLWNINRQYKKALKAVPKEQRGMIEMQWKNRFPFLR